MPVIRDKVSFKQKEIKLVNC